MNKTELINWTREMLEAEIINMNEKNFQLQSEVNNLRESNARIQEQIKLATSPDPLSLATPNGLYFEINGIEYNSQLLVNEYEKLKLEVQRLREKCGETPKKEDDITHIQGVLKIDEESFRDAYEAYCTSRFGNPENTEQDIDHESIIYELEEQHRKDCNKIDELTITVKALSEILSDLKSRMDECWEM